jgi:photosystem II stability/assembly factor-like uncharacterized protein
VVTRWLPLFAAGCDASWTVVAEDLPEAPLSVAGTADDDVWMVGGDVGDGPLVAHSDGSTWARLDTSTTGDLWWVFPTSDAAWMVGARGRVVRWDRADAVAVEEIVDEDVTLFGVWGPGDGTLWAVGADLSVGAGGARLYRFDGAWIGVDLSGVAPDAAALYKVWGLGADDVTVVGAGGLALRYDGAAWSVEDSATDALLFTVAGDDEGRRYAVGGAGAATIVECADGVWNDASPAFAPQQNGVFARDGRVVSVGREGSSFERADAGWEPTALEPATDLDLHAVWIAPDGGVWAVGGSISSAPLDAGVVLYNGPGRPPDGL